jgi:hypothetical protein
MSRNCSADTTSGNRKNLEHYPVQSERTFVQIGNTGISVSPPDRKKKREIGGGIFDNLHTKTVSAAKYALFDTMAITGRGLTEFSNHFNANTRFIMGDTIQNRAQIHNKRLRAMEFSKRNKYCARLIRLRLAFALSVAYTVVQCELYLF